MAASDGRCSIRSGRNLRCCDQSYISHTGSCKLSLFYKPTSEGRSAGNPHATFRGSRTRVTASGHPVVSGDRHPYRDRHMLPLPQKRRAVGVAFTTVQLSYEDLGDADAKCHPPLRRQTR